jgi:serine/threonine protein phosphatase PrpC
MNTDWRIIAESITGHSHFLKNRPNQDNGGLNNNTFPYPLIGAVSDGHGGREYFRSERGSAFAIQTAIKVLSDFYVQNLAFHSDNNEIICKTIIEEWKKIVLEDIQKNPYDAKERDIIEKGRLKRELNNPESVKYCEIRPYGSTLLATIISEGCVTFFQLGDGDIIIHSHEGYFIRPITPDENLTGNETYSLCTYESWKNFRVTQIQYHPDFLMLSTDGYANSYFDDNGFITVARDFYSLIYQSDNFDEGIHLVQSNIHKWLTITSQKGSGDDITLIIFAQDPIKNKPRGNTTFREILLLNPILSEPDFKKILNCSID